MQDNIMYPFGYGLTFSNVVYENPEILNKKFKGKEDLKVKIQLTNTSNMPVDEVVQVYLSSPTAGLGSPISSLIDFKRVSIGASETKMIEFHIAPESLKTIQEDGLPKLLKGEYTLTISGAAPGTRTEELNVPSTKLKFKL